MEQNEAARPRVLVVDDDASDRLRVEAILTASGYAVEQAESGRKALRLFVEHPTAAVVTDLAMTDGDGLYLIDLLRTVRADVKVVAVSGRGPGGLAIAEAKGVAAILAKPVDPGELLTALATALAPASAGPP